MPRDNLEKRVAELEKQVHGLLADQAQPAHARDWRRTIGAFTGDEIMKEIFAEGRKIRDAERRHARRPQKKQPRTHS
jgi:hypothetical protein